MVKTVEAETREMMRDHFKARLLPLRPHRVNDTCFTDTFFSSIKSVRGYSMWQLYSLQETCHDTVFLMKRKSEVPSTLEDYVQEVGAPNIIVYDGTKEATSNKWTNVLHHFCMDECSTEAYHQNQNLAERRGGNLKSHFDLLFHKTGADA